MPLAQRGYKVTHLDFSPAMLEAARQKAQSLPGIEFLEGNATDLSCFQDRSFDLEPGAMVLRRCRAMPHATSAVETL